jgi:hypothetical protein
MKHSFIFYVDTLWDAPFFSNYFFGLFLIWLVVNFELDRMIVHVIKS